MYVAAECGCKLVIFMMLRRQIFEEIEDQAVLIVKCGFGGDNALVEVVKLLWCLGRVSFAPCPLSVTRLRSSALHDSTYL